MELLGLRVNFGNLRAFALLSQITKAKRGMTLKNKIN
jgi:hypothetical protein